MCPTPHTLFRTGGIWVMAKDSRGWLDIWNVKTTIQWMMDMCISLSGLPQDPTKGTWSHIALTFMHSVCKLQVYWNFQAVNSCLLLLGMLMMWTQIEPYSKWATTWTGRLQDRLIVLSWLAILRLHYNDIPDNWGYYGIISAAAPFTNATDYFLTLIVWIFLRMNFLFLDTVQ